MKIATNIAGGLLGFIFVGVSLMVLLNLGPAQTPPTPGSPEASFMGAFVHPAGSLSSLLELTGGILVAIPKTRNFGLLVLGPIVVNILAFHIFIKQGDGLMGLPLWSPSWRRFFSGCGRSAFARLLN